MGFRAITMDLCFYHELSCQGSAALFRCDPADLVRHVMILPNLPARFRALSRLSRKLVAPITVMKWFGLNPSFSHKIWLRVCLDKPSSPFDGLPPIASISSIKIMHGC